MSGKDSWPQHFPWLDKLLPVSQFSSVQSLSRVWRFATPWTAARQASLSITNSQSLLKLMSIKLVMPSNHLILCHPLLLLPSIFPSIRVFPVSQLLHQAARVLEFQLQHQSFQWIFRVDFLYDWLVWSHLVQETLKSLLQHHKWEALILQGSAFSALLLLLGPCCFCPLLCPSLHELFPWYLQFSWRDL